MKVVIGPYKSWTGPYQLAHYLKYVGVSEERRSKIGEWLADTWVSPVCNWIYEKRRRRVKIRVDYWDTWNLDHTLALIIIPCLKQLKREKHGTPGTDVEDGPEEFKEEKDFSSKRWEWILDEMIWSFENIVDEDNHLIWNKETEERVQNGLRLFGKYYRSLWD